jgi:hypothetical protein
VAGIAIGLFLSPSSVPSQGAGGVAGQLTLTACGLGFLAGYASHSFFAYLDRVVSGTAIDRQRYAGNDASAPFWLLTGVSTIRICTCDRRTNTRDAQSRIVRAVELAVSQTPERVDIAIVGHGGTGTLLYCHLAGVAIDRRYDQPATNGGN